MNLTLVATVLPRFAILSGGILKGLRDGLMETAESLYEGGVELFMKLSFFGNILNKSYGIMPELTRTADGWEVTEGLVTPFMRVGQSFGAALALIFMIAAMIDIYTQEKMSVETFAKPFLQYLITVAFMTKAELIIAALWNLGVLFQQKMALAGNSVFHRIDISFVEDASLGAVIGIFLGAILMLLVCFFLGVVIRVCAYIANFSRVIEAALRAIGLPIALGIATDSSFRQGALRYVKKFLAVSLQGGIFTVISFLYLSVSVHILTTTSENLSNATDITGDFAENVQLKFDETNGTVIAEAAEAVGVEIAEEIEAGIAMAQDAIPVAVAAMSAAGVLYQVITTIIPIIGLALACIVVLFKSGQICNDIVGA